MLIVPGRMWSIAASCACSSARRRSGVEGLAGIWAGVRDATSVRPIVSRLSDRSRVEQRSDSERASRHGRAGGSGDRRLGPRSLSGAAAAFAREVVTRAAPVTPGRAKALLFAAGRLAVFAESVGLELEPRVVLSGARIERFVLVGCPTVSPATRRTLPDQPAGARARDRALPRAGSGARRCASARRRRTRPSRSTGSCGSPMRRAPGRAGCVRARWIRLGAGAGVIAGELRHVRGRDVVARSGGMLVTVGGARSRSVAVFCRYHERLLKAASFAGDRFIIGGRGPGSAQRDRQLVRAAVDRQRATEAAGRAAAIHVACGVLPTDRATGVHAGRRDHLQPAARGPRRATPRRLRDRADRAARRAERVSAELERIEQIIDTSGVAGVIERRLPVGLRPRQLHVRTLLIAMTFALRAGRQAFLTDVHTTLDNTTHQGPAAARRDRPLAARRAPAHLPPGRIHV